MSKKAKQEYLLTLQERYKKTDKRKKRKSKISKIPVIEILKAKNNKDGM